MLQLAGEHLLKSAVALVDSQSLLRFSPHYGQGLADLMRKVSQKLRHTLERRLRSGQRAINAVAELVEFVVCANNGQALSGIKRGKLACSGCNLLQRTQNSSSHQPAICAVQQEQEHDNGHDHDAGMSNLFIGIDQGQAHPQQITMHFRSRYGNIQDAYSAAGEREILELFMP